MRLGGGGGGGGVVVQGDKGVWFVCEWWWGVLLTFISWNIRR